MKILGQLFLALLLVSTPAHAAEDQALSQQANQLVQQQTGEMSALGVQEAKAKKMLTLMHRNRFQHQNMVVAQKVVMNTAKEGLPTEPVMSKAMEGMAKQVPEEKVIAAMEEVRNRYSYAYRKARSLAEDEKSTDEIASVIADGLAAGMTEDDMDAIMTRLEVQTRERTRNHAENIALQTMQTVRTMARLGAVTTDVSETVCQALAHNYTERQMEQLGRQFVNQAQHTPSSQLGHAYARSMGKDGTVGNSANEGAGRGGEHGGSQGAGGSNGGGNSGGSGSSGGGGGSDSGSGGGSGGSGSGGGSGNGGGSGGSGGGGGNGGSGGGGSR